MTTPTDDTNIPAPGPWSHPMWHQTKTASGIALIPYLPKRPVDAPSLVEVVSLWRRAEASTFEEFYCRFDKEACNDWGNMQPDGSDYGGAWDAPEGSEEHENAWQLTRKLNGVALAALPYPPSVILYAVRYLCPRRCESVKRVADWLDWIRGAVAAEQQIVLPLTPGLQAKLEPEVHGL